MRNILAIFTLLIIASCATAQPGQWHTKSKKAIKYVEAAMDASRERNMQTGRPDFSTALSLLDKAIEKDPNFQEAYLLKAQYSMESGDALGAIEAYNHLEQLPNFSSSTGYVYFDMAALEMSQGMYDEALVHATKYANCFYSLHTS